MNNVVQFAFITTESGQSAKNVLTFRADGSIKYDSVVFNQQAIATKNSNSTLKTADKTLVGAINELADSVESVSWNDLKDKPFYVEMKEVTVEVAPEVMGYSDILLDGFPPFNVGDTVTVKVDGVEHSLVAFFDDGCATIGDTYAEFENGNGSFGWYIYCVENEVVFDSLNYHTLTYQGEIVHKIDPKYISNFATPVIDPTNYNAFMFSYHLNTDESFTEFDAVRADEFEILRNVIKWGLENRAVFYNFNYGFTYSIMINPPHEFTGGYESIQIQANFCNLPGFYNNAMDYTWYMDSDFRIWGKCYYFQENLFNETN